MHMCTHALGALNLPIFPPTSAAQVRMIRLAKRRDLVAPPVLPHNVGMGCGEVAAAGEGAEGGADKEEDGKRKRVKGLSKSLRNRAGR